ncbi:MAG: C25 family cysteine peptidase, partial [candidate division WOR-3 bacterium]|nr:C25 family cysteine peptidase [candidate division WOR-3 bacterium]
MKSKFLGCCIIIALAISSYAGATWVQFGTGETTETTVLKSNDSHTIVEFTVPGMDVRDTVVDGTTYQIISVPTAGIPDEVGKPQTPVINRTVAVDPSKGVELNILEVECDTLSGFYIWPVQEPIPELMGVGPPEFVIDTVAYSQDSFYPDIVSEISDPMIWRDYRIVKLHCNPIQFNPVTGELRAYSRVKVSIDYSGTSDKNVLDKSLGPTPNYDKLYRDFIINYDYVTPKGPPGEGAYLIITHDDFYNAILPFAEWKHKKGIWTEVVKFSDINTGAPDSADIHNYIKWAYTNWLVPLEYVLLVGDVDFLACGYRPGSGCMPDGKYATDHCYSLIAGDDIFSDVYVGRLPANTTVECSTMVDKLINYERNPYMTATDWYKKYTGVCITQAGRIFDYTTGVIGHILDDYGYIQTDSLNSPLPQAISDSIE